MFYRIEPGLIAVPDKGDTVQLKPDVHKSLPKRIYIVNTKLGVLQKLHPRRLALLNRDLHSAFSLF